MGGYLDQLVPLIMKFCNIDDDELREYSIQAFESFILKCPKEITAYVGQVCVLLLVLHSTACLNGLWLSSL